MATIKPFHCIRPKEEVAAQVAALPYDVYNRKEACEEVKNKPLSFLRIDRAETSFDDSVDTYDEKVYAKAKELLELQMNEGVFLKEKVPCYYIYELSMQGRAQTGIVAIASVDDYLNNVIKKHELTREEKEQDRIRHVDTCNAQTGPIFLAYRGKETINAIVDQAKLTKPLYQFVSDDGVGHVVWVINKEEDVKTIADCFGAINEIYIADGHHRAASAVKVALKRREAAALVGKTDDSAEYNYFLSVLFPDSQLKILDYNRAVKDLNGLTKDEFLAKVSERFVVSERGTAAVAPQRKATFGMYLDGTWYELEAKEEIKEINDPVKALDVAILQDNLLSPILGISDPRTDNRIDFIGGIRGLAELERRVNSDMMVAFAMYPTSIGELFDVADANLLMPPKSTWFEPKLRSGLFIHGLEDN